MPDIQTKWDGWDRDTIAQKIENDIEEWRKSANAGLARRKWIWELLQNAVDPAVHASQENLVIHLTAKDGMTTFSHNGAYGVFTNEEFYRLLTRSTSKSKDDDECRGSEGRFGEGFITTHVLSRRVRVQGVVGENGEYRRLNAIIDRTGDWKAIRHNIEDTRTRVFTAPASPATEHRGAVFSYMGADEDTAVALDTGLRDLRTSVQYFMALMLARHNVAITLRVSDDSGCTTFAAARADMHRDGDSPARRVTVKEMVPDKDIVDHDLILYETANEGHFLMVPVSEEPKSVLLPSPGEHWPVPRLFTLCPLLRADDLPLSCIVAGRLSDQDYRGWTVGKDRFDVDYGDETTKMMLGQDVSVIPSLWGWLSNNGYINAHRVLHVAPTVRDDGGVWWSEKLKELATGFCDLPSVTTEQNHPPAEERAKDRADDAEARKERPLPASEVWFPAVPEDVDPSCKTTDQNLVRDAWELLKISGRRIPTESLVHDWYVMVREWEKLGVDGLERYNIALFTRIVNGCDNLEALSASEALPGLSAPGASEAFLGRLVEAYAAYKKRAAVTPDFVTNAKVYCSQDGRLHTTSDVLYLEPEEAIPEDVKQVSRDTGSDLLNCLLIRRQAGGVAREWCREHWGELTKKAAVERVLADLQNVYRGGKCTPSAAAKFLMYMFRKRADTEVRKAVEDWSAVPVATKDDEVTVLSDRKGRARFLAPVALLADGLRPYIGLFGPDLILSNRYAEAADEADRSQLSEFLEEIRIATSDGFFEETTKLDASGVRVLSQTKTDKDHSFREISLWDFVGLGELLGSMAVGGGDDGAVAALELILGHLVSDDHWRQFIRADGDCSMPGHGEECRGLMIRPAEWFRKVTEQKWIRRDRDDPLVVEPPNPHNLGRLVNRVRGLLVNPRANEFLELLDCDRLDLALARFSGTEDDHKAARNALADIATRARSLADLQAIEELWTTHERERDRVSKNHILGEAVQMAIARALRDKGIAVTGDQFKNLPARDLIALGKGEDPEREMENITLKLRRNRNSPEGVWIEVKSASTDEVKMTEPQAAAASERLQTHGGHYELCVVDFGKLDITRESVVDRILAAGPDEGARAKYIEDLAPSLIEGITMTSVGRAIAPRFEDLGTLGKDETHSGVRVEPGSAPRFLIDRSLWDGPTSKRLEEWVEELPTIAEVLRDTTETEGAADAAPEGGEDGQAQT